MDLAQSNFDEKSELFEDYKTDTFCHWFDFWDSRYIKWNQLEK